MSVLVKPDQVRQATYGSQIISPAQVVPTGSTTLWTIAGGPIRITGVYAVVTTVFTATVTTLNIGAAGSATNLFNAAALTSLTVGSVLVGAPTPAVPVVVANGTVTWIASAGNTGQLQIYFNYIPLIPAVTVQ
jgi:hypothetical protein